MQLQLPCNDFDQQRTVKPFAIEKKEHADSALLCLFLTFHWLVAWKQEPRLGWKASSSSPFLLLLVLGPFSIFVGVSSIEHVSFLALTTFAKLWLEFPDA